MSRIFKEKQQYGLVIDVDDAGTYRLLIDGEVTFNSKVIAAVEIEFAEALAARSETVRDARLREQAHYQMQALLSQTAQSKAAGRNAGRARGKGG